MAYSSGGLTGEVFLPGEKTREEVNEIERDSRLSGFVQGLHEEARRRRMARGGVEQRWLEDIRQFHGQYDADTLKKLDEGKLSKVFVNLTGPKTEAYEARLYDLLFPTDERNWGISPTPVPELSEAGKRIAQQLLEAKQLADQQQQAMMEHAQAGNMEMAQGQETAMRQTEVRENQLMVRQQELQLTMQQATQQARMMEDKLADHLAHCNYPVEARDVIQDACRIGLGVMKGPVVGDKPKTKWIKNVQTGQYELTPVDDQKPAVHRVDPWLFFPEPDVKRLSDSQGFFELHPMNKSQLRGLAKRKGFRKETIRELLRLEPDSTDTPMYLSDLHNVTGQNDGKLKQRYMVWEYTGPVECDLLKLLAEAFWDDEEGQEIESPAQDRAEGPVGEMQEEVTEERDEEDRPEEEPEATPRRMGRQWLEEIDPLAEISVRVWFCQGKVLSFGLHPLDSERPMYKAFTLREDETSPFGYGVPWIMRHPQNIINGSYRMLMDNAALSTGPQIVVNKDAVEPQDGSWELRPRKVWTFKGASVTNNVKPFDAFNIDANQNELIQIIQLAAQTIDEVTSMPQIAQGEQGAGVTKTAQGMALLLNSANVTFRRTVKNWDDGITSPVIQDLHDWEMQFGEDEAIKGDYCIVARGASVLLVREMQAQNLMFIAQALGNDPEYAKYLKKGELLKTLFRALMVNADDITLTETEVKELEAKQQPVEDPRITAARIEQETKMAMIEADRERAQVDIAIAEMETDAKKMVARATYEKDMTQIAEETNRHLTSTEADLAKSNMVEASKERVIAAEIAMKQQTGESAGGSV